MIAPGQYFLVQEAGGTAGAPISADFTDTTPINMSGTAGKVALVSSAAPLGCNGGSTACPAAALASIVDLVGYGSANFFEGTGPAPSLSNTTSGGRREGGCTDTDQNGADFTSGAAAPRNSLSPIHPCDSQPVLTIDNVTTAEGNSGSASATFTVRLSAPAPAAVTFNIATQDDSATSAEGDDEPKSLAGQTILAGQDTSAFTVVVNGDTAVETNETFFVNVTAVVGAAPGDTQGLGTITNDDVVTPVFDVVISQVYGGGGNSGATYTNDFIELFNHGVTTVSLAGWSVQYSSSTGTGSWQSTPLSGLLPPGGYFLVQQAAGTGGTSGLPAPDATGTIASGSASGKVALTTSSAPLVGACVAGATIVALVGYGTATTCHEGSGPASQLTNTTAALRK